MSRADAGWGGAGEPPRGEARSARDRVRRYYRVVSPFIDREHREGEDDAFWRRIAERHRDGAALDLGCGTGRLTEILAGTPISRDAPRVDPEDDPVAGPVVGIDLSPEMILRARKRFGGPPRQHLRDRPGQGLGDPPPECPDGEPPHPLRGSCRQRRVHLAVADLRRLPLNRRFHLVVAGGDPFAHLLDDAGRDRGLAAVAERLAPGGRFALDALWFPPENLERARTPGGLELEHRGEGLTVRERWRCTPDGLCRARYEYRRGGKVLETAAFRGRHWTVPEVHRRFTRAGLQVEHLWGDYEGTPWAPGSADRLLVEAVTASGRS